MKTLLHQTDELCREEPFLSLDEVTTELSKIYTLHQETFEPSEDLKKALTIADSANQRYQKGWVVTKILDNGKHREEIKYTDLKTKEELIFYDEDVPAEIMLKESYKLLQGLIELYNDSCTNQVEHVKMYVQYFEEEPVTNNFKNIFKGIGKTIKAFTKEKTDMEKEFFDIEIYGYLGPVFTSTSSIIYKLVPAPLKEKYIEKNFGPDYSKSEDGEFSFNHLKSHLGDIEDYIKKSQL